MATNTVVTFTHTIGSLSYEKYDTKGIYFDLSSLHSRANTYILNASMMFTNYYSTAVSVDIDFGLGPYTTNNAGASVATIRTTVNVPANTVQSYVDFTFTYTSASNQNNVWDKPFCVKDYALVNAPQNVYIQYSPVINSIVRKYNIPVPAAGDKITHSDLAAFATWCKMTGSATHTTTYTVLDARDTNRPWGTGVTMINNSGTSVTTSSTYSKTAGTAVSKSWISDALSACSNRSWTR